MHCGADRAGDPVVEINARRRRCTSSAPASRIADEPRSFSARSRWQRADGHDPSTCRGSGSRSTAATCGSPDVSEIWTGLLERSSTIPRHKSEVDASGLGMSVLIGDRYGITDTGAPSTMVSSATSATAAPIGNRISGRHRRTRATAEGDPGTACPHPVGRRRRERPWPTARPPDRFPTATACARTSLRPAHNTISSPAIDDQSTRSLDFDGNRATAVEQHAAGCRATFDRQVGAIAIGSDVREGRVDPDTVDDVARQSSPTRFPGSVLVDLVRETKRRCRPSRTPR